MKKYLLTILLISLFLIPFTVSARDVLYEEKEKIDVFFFWGDGCGHCEVAKEFFNSMDEEYKSYYNLRMYEVWYDTNGRDLMLSMAKDLNETPDYIPYIIIGDKSFEGSVVGHKDELKDAIKNLYNKINNIPEETFPNYSLSKKNESLIKLMQVGIFIFIGVIVATGYYISYKINQKKELN